MERLERPVAVEPDALQLRIRGERRGPRLRELVAETAERLVEPSRLGVRQLLVGARPIALGGEPHVLAPRPVPLAQLDRPDLLLQEGAEPAKIVRSRAAFLRRVRGGRRCVLRQHLPVDVEQLVHRGFERSLAAEAGGDGGGVGGIVAGELATERLW